MAPFERDTLELTREAACGLRPDLRVAYANPAWKTFAAANGAPSEDPSSWGVGANVLASVSPVLQPFHRAMFERARASGEVVEHDYECSSPTQRRVFRMRIHPCPSGGFVVVHSLLREAPPGDVACPPLDALYRDARGLVVQCANCRRVRQVAAQATPGAAWDWVPEYVARMPPQTSHAICRPCADFYYGDAVLARI